MTSARAGVRSDNDGPFIPAEPGNMDAGYEMKAMDSIANNAERDDVRRLFRIEVK